MKKLLRAVQVAALVGAIAHPSFTHAQERASEEQPVSYGDDEVEARGVGISGGIIGGAEIVVAVEAFIGVKKLWPYLTLPLVGAAGGGVGGYYLEKESPKGAVGLLVASMVLVIPTAILASSARAYNPEEEGSVGSDTDDKFSFEQAPASGAEQGATTEVEAKPEGAPTDTALPAGAEQPPERQKTEPETEAPEEAPDSEAAPEEGAKAPTGTGAKNNAAKKAARLAAIRRASAGSLLYVDNDGTASFSVPFVDVRPMKVSSEDGFFKTKQAIEVFVPIFRLDLP